MFQDVASKQQSELRRGDLQLISRIGRGASGEVWTAMMRGTEVAVKKIVAKSNSSKVREEFKLESAIMWYVELRCRTLAEVPFPDTYFFHSALRHPNVVMFMGSCFDTTTNPPEMLLVMEFLARGSLHDVLHSGDHNVTYNLQLHIAYQAALGINFLHQATPPILHRDLKSHNILIDDKWNARISDFGYV